MSQTRDRDGHGERDLSPPRKRDPMPSYSYYFSDCSSIISSVKCAVSVEDEKSRSTSPNFGNPPTSYSDPNRNDGYAEDRGLSVEETVVCDLNDIKSNPATADLVNSNSCTFDNEDELASASMEPYAAMTNSSGEDMLDRLPTFGEAPMGESFYKFTRWCKNYANGNIESFRKSQTERMKTILEENKLHVGDTKNSHFDEFPFKVLYRRGTTLTDNKFDVAALRAGDLLVDRYQVDEIIGNTSFSTVARATDLATGAKVCLKIVLPDYFDQALDETFLLRLLNAKDEEEAKPIVRLLDSFLHCGAVFLVMELLGENLFQASKDFYAKSARDIVDSARPRRWSLNELRDISYDILTALKFIHNFGIINCDLKPENLVLVEGEDYAGPEGRRHKVKLVDFGSSCFIRDKLNTYVQSRSYRAPEVVLGLPYDTQIDLWSLGCILCELYMGRILFPSDNSATLVASMVSLLGVPPVYMLQHKMNSMFIILPNGSVADLNAPPHILSLSPHYNKADRSSLCCNLSVSDSSKCSHVTYNKWDNTTVNMDPTLDDNSSAPDDSSDYNRNAADENTKPTPGGLEKTMKITRYDESLRHEAYYRNSADCKIKLDIRHGRNGAPKLMRMIQPCTASIDAMLDSKKGGELALFADFVKGLLQYDPLDRLTAAAALQHPFILSRPQAS